MSVRQFPAVEFQSTLPAKGATTYKATGNEDYHISIHAPREGSDNTLTMQFLSFSIFQSTLPAKGATFILNKSLDVLILFQSTLPAKGAT